MNRLKILIASSEIFPFAKTGGLADVSGFLPGVIAGLGHEVKTIMPRYDSIPNELLSAARHDKSLNIKLDGITHRLDLYRQTDMVTLSEQLFIANDHFFGRAGIYQDPATQKDYPDNDERFLFFCRGILESLKCIDWQPDIIHANDWQTALLPSFLATSEADDDFYADTATLFTIHNLAYQGLFPAKTFTKLNLAEELFSPTGPFEFYKKTNYLKSAIWYADIINTVSDRYAQEIQSDPEYGCGLEGVLKSRSKDLHGIVNGVDYDEWSPEKDKYIPFKYSRLQLSGKRNNKVELVNRVGLPMRDHVPLIGIISRLADQKGFDLIEEAADELLSLDLQLVILGTGDKKYHTLLKQLQTKYPDKCAAILNYDNDLAHLIEAGADMFLMPSRYEPCGLNQLYSLKYGTVPIVRKTGGLADTIEDFDPVTKEGTGFVFEKYDADEMIAAIKRALAIFPKKRIWRTIAKAGMKKDFSWNRSAQKYINLYNLARAKK